MFFLYPPGWFMDIHWSMTSIVILTVWHTVGYYMVILLAGLQNINTELYEAAAIDGANARQRYFRITLPMLTPSLFFIMIMSMINSLKVFDQVSVATQGGPGTSSFVLVYRCGLGAGYNTQSAGMRPGDSATAGPCVQLSQ